MLHTFNQASLYNNSYHAISDIIPSNLQLKPFNWPSHLLIAGFNPSSTSTPCGLLYILFTTCIYQLTAGTALCLELQLLLLSQQLSGKAAATITTAQPVRALRRAACAACAPSELESGFNVIWVEQRGCSHMAEVLIGAAKVGRVFGTALTGMKGWRRGSVHHCKKCCKAAFRTHLKICQKVQRGYLFWGWGSFGQKSKG